MSRNSQTIKNLTWMALFVAVEVLLLVTPFGYLRIGPLSATLLHIPVIICACLMGVKKGALLGLVFGITSVINATMAPTITSFVFSPFVSVAGLSGGWQSLIIAIVPRVLLGVIAGFLFEVLSKKMKAGMAGAISAGIATVCHTIMVLGLIYICYGEAYAQALNMAVTALMAYFGTVFVTNCIPETLLAVACAAALCSSMKNRR